MRTEFLCISVLRIAMGPRMKFSGCKRVFNTLHPPPPPHSLPRVVYSADRSKAVVLVLFLFFVALCSFVVPALFSVCFYMFCDASIVVTVFNSCRLCFVFY